MPGELEETLRQLPAIRYAAVVATGSGRAVATLEPWPGPEAEPISYDTARQALAIEHGSANADAVHAVIVFHVPVTEQGKPDRAAITALAPG